MGAHASTHGTHASYTLDTITTFESSLFSHIFTPIDVASECMLHLLQVFEHLVQMSGLNVASKIKKASFSIAPPLIFLYKDSFQIFFRTFVTPGPYTNPSDYIGPVIDNYLLQAVTINFLSHTSCCK